MKQIAEKFVPCSLTDNRKQNWVCAFKDLQDQAIVDRSVLSVPFWRLSVPSDESLVKVMKVWGHYDESSWITGCDGQHREMGVPGMLPVVRLVLHQVYKLVRQPCSIMLPVTRHYVACIMTPEIRKRRYNTSLTQPRQNTEAILKTYKLFIYGDIDYIKFFVVVCLPSWGVY